jgi:hypothetical protein
VPTSEIVCPPKNNLKFRCRNARQACETPSSASGGVTGAVILSVGSVELLKRSDLL